MSKDKINHLLKDIVKAVNFVKCDVKVQEIPSGGANYTSKLYKVELVPPSDEQGGPFFVKMACPSVKLRSVLDEWKIYKTETFFYTKLVKTFEAIENENDVPKEHRVVFPKYYGSHTKTYEEVIVLEDLTANKWLAYDRFKPITWPYAKAAISELAKFHSLSLAYSEKNPTEFKKVLEDLKTEMNTKALSGYVNNARDVALQKVKPEYKEGLQAYLKDFEAKIKKVNEPMSRNVITHGVYRPSNLMHKIREDGTVEIRIVDLQTLQGASPVVDLLYFIFTGSDEEFRGQYFRKLAEHYYAELAEAMRRLHLDPEKVYPRAAFDTEMKEKLPYGLTIAVFALPVVTVSVEDAPKVDEDMDLSAFSIDKASDLYVERLNGVVKDFAKWGYLK